MIVNKLVFRPQKVYIRLEESTYRTRIEITFDEESIKRLNKAAIEFHTEHDIERFEKRIKQAVREKVKIREYGASWLPPLGTGLPLEVNQPEMHASPFDSKRDIIFTLNHLGNHQWEVKACALVPRFLKRILHEFEFKDEYSFLFQLLGAAKRVKNYVISKAKALVS